MKSIFTILSFCLGAISLTAQNGSLEYIEAISIEINQHNQVYYRHTLKPKETAYSLARYFKLPIEDLYLVNKISSDDVLSVGTQLIIPIDISLLRTPINKKNENWIPVIYTVAKQETLFKIAHSYFPQPIQNLITRNKVNSFSLKTGRNLVVGWWGSEEVRVKAEDFVKSKRTEVEATETQSNERPRKKVIERERHSDRPNETESVADLIRNKIIKRAKVNSEGSTDDITENEANESREEIEEKIITRDRNQDEEYPTRDTIISDLVVVDTLEQEENIDEPEINYKSGIATWDKQGLERENLFVMHNQAKANSYIRLRHPVTKKEVTALVIAPIPNGIHSSEVDIVLSPAVALALGALNTMFKIEMDYYQ